MFSCCHEKHHHDHDHRGDFERPLVLIRSFPHDGQIDVSPDIKAIKLVFSRDFNNDPCLANVVTDIDMWHGSHRVPIRIKRGTDNCDGHRVILVIPIHHLKGGAFYKVRIKSIFVDRNGDEFARFKLIVFRTGCR